jgi:ubiquinone/menaquinone biosynthesis C-methylase UbiE
MNQGLRLLGVRMFAPKPGMTLLDVGCGTGAQLELYRRFDCRLFGIDSSESMLAVAKTKLADSADLRLGDAAELPYASGMFDLVISMLSLHEMRPQVRIGAVEEMKRVLKDTGRILLIDHHPGPIQPVGGWITKAIVLIAEAAAGQEHFRNYRHFMSIKGLPAITEMCGLGIIKSKVVGGGALALQLLEKQPYSPSNRRGIP